MYFICEKKYIHFSILLRFYTPNILLIAEVVLNSSSSGNCCKMNKNQLEVAETRSCGTRGSKCLKMEIDPNSSSSMNTLWKQRNERKGQDFCKFQFSNISPESEM